MGPHSSASDATESHPGSGRLAVEHTRGSQALSRLAPVWTSLAAPGSPYPVLFGWYRNYVAALEPRPEELNFFTLAHGERALAVVPLRAGARTLRGLRLRTLELPWHPEMAVTDLVAERGGLDGAGAEALAEATKRAGIPWDALVFRGVTDTSAAYRWSHAWPRSVRIPMGHRDYLVTDRPYDEMRASFSKNFRGNLRKARNKLRATEGVAFVRAPGEMALEQALALFLQVEASGWKGAGGTAIEADPARVRFYAGLVRDAEVGGACEINLLTLAGRPLAGQFCVRAGAVLHLLKIGYDEAYAPLAPGNMLLEHLLEGCAARGIREVDLVTDAPWHADWRPSSQPVCEVVILNRTARGSPAWFAYRARRALEGLLR